MDDRRKRQFQFSGGYWLLAFAALLLLQNVMLRGMGPKASVAWHSTKEATPSSPFRFHTPTPSTA